MSEAKLVGCESPLPSDPPSPVKPKATRQTVRKTARKTKRVKASSGAAKGAALAAAGADRIGRPRRPFDESTARTVLDGLAVGLPLQLAADGAKVSLDVVYRWAVENEQFACGIKKAQQDFARETLERLRTSPAGTWQREAWILERRFPQHFGQNARLEIQATQRQEVTAQFCQELSDSWKTFVKDKVVDVEVVKIGNAPTDEHNARGSRRMQEPSRRRTESDQTPAHGASDARGEGGPPSGTPRIGGSE